MSQKVMWEGKVIGEIYGRQFRKNVKGSKHKLLKPEAWAIDANVYDKLLKGKIDKILIFDTEGNDEYVATAGDFEKYKKEMNRGYDRQYYLVMSFWMINGHAPKAHLRIDADKQMSLGI